MSRAYGCTGPSSLTALPQNPAELEVREFLTGRTGERLGETEASDCAQDQSRANHEDVPAWGSKLVGRPSPLLKMAVAGDAEALSTLLEQVRPLVYRWAKRRTGDLDDAEDITQQVMVRMYRGLSSFRGESKLSSWLFRITAHEASGFFRERSRKKDLHRSWCREWEVDSSDPYDPERIDHVRAAGSIQKAATSLPPLQREAFRLVDLGGLNPCEAAEELGKAQVNIRSSLCRARKKIRELVEECRAVGAVRDQDCPYHVRDPKRG